MNKRHKILQSPTYWLVRAQNELFKVVNDFKIERGLTHKTLGEYLNVSKARISQILNGDFNHTLKTLFDISSKLGKVPVISFKDVQEVIEIDGLQGKHKDSLGSLKLHMTSAYTTVKLHQPSIG